MSNLISVKSDSIDNLIASLKTQYENVSKSLSDASTIISNMSNCIDSDVLVSITSKFNGFESNFPLLKENLQSFIEDFSILNKDFASQQSSVFLSNVEIDKGGEVVNVKY